MSPTFPAPFGAALEAELRRRVTRSARPWWRRRWWAIAGAVVLLTATGTAGALATGLLPLPGGTVADPLGGTVAETHTGPATVRLGARPSGATGVSIELMCLSAGSLVFPGGAEVRCGADDVGSRSSLVVAVGRGEDGIRIGADRDAAWRVAATWVRATTTPWATNDRGQTYGVANEHGEPDLIAVVATNGRDGYVDARQLADADGSTAARRFTSPQQALDWQKRMKGKRIVVPVYRSDGATRVGDFVVQY